MLRADTATVKNTHTGIHRYRNGYRHCNGGYRNGHTHRNGFRHCNDGEQRTTTVTTCNGPATV